MNAICFQIHLTDNNIIFVPIEFSIHFQLQSKSKDDSSAVLFIANLYIWIMCYLDIITLLPFFIEMLQYDWL